MSKESKFELDFLGRKLVVETNRMADQNNASCLVRYGDTMILLTAALSKEPRQGVDFFPLMIEVQEKMYAAGKIKGSRFIKRDGRPTDNAVLDGRMIDRGIRPLFNQGLRHEVQVVTSFLSYDGENSPDILSLFAAGLALSISDIPWNGPLAGICVGRINGELIANPTISQLAQSDMKLVFSVSRQGVMMVDAEAKEVSEADIAKAFEFGIAQAKPLLDFIDLIVKKIGRPKKDESVLLAAIAAQGEVPMIEKETAWTEAKKFFASKIDKYLFNQPVGTKRARKEVASKLLDEYLEPLKTKEIHEEIITYIKQNFEGYLEGEVTKAILDKDLRVDGRSLNDIRSLKSEVGLLPRTHGSALFSRGETQVLSVVTLGSPGDAQILDEMTENDTKKTYIHHYDAPPFAYGEVGMFRGAGRREIGHGALAEKALVPVLPDKLTFPYTILVSSTVMGSNGSSSMASTCGSTLALMDAGVPIKKPVAGIAMGLASDGKRHKILTDLQDLEDGEGGMDFKITGTRDGITAIQMDTKTLGLSLELCRETLTRSKEARLKILDHISQLIAEPRKELSPFAPRIVTMKIDPKKIGDVIGTGGKIINEIIDTCGVEIDIDDSGIVTITSINGDGAKKAIEWIEKLTKEVEVGEIYEGKVVRLMDFGAFVEILPGQDGLVHISELAARRVDRVSDVVKIGDTVRVKVIEIDMQNRINLSMRQADPNYDPKSDSREPRERRDGFHRGGPRRDGKPSFRPRR